MGGPAENSELVLFNLYLNVSLGFVSGKQNLLRVVKRSSQFPRYPL